MGHSLRFICLCYFFIIWTKWGLTVSNEMLTTQRLVAKLLELEKVSQLNSPLNEVERAVFQLYFHDISEARGILLDVMSRSTTSSLSALHAISVLACSLSSCQECRRSIDMLSRMGNSSLAASAAALTKATTASDGSNYLPCHCKSSLGSSISDPFDCAMVPIFFRAWDAPPAAAAAAVLGVHFLDVAAVRDNISHGWADYAAALEAEVEAAAAAGDGDGGPVRHTVTTLLYLPVGPAAALRLTVANLRRIMRAALAQEPAAAAAAAGSPPLPTPLPPPTAIAGRRLRVVHLVRPHPPPAAAAAHFRSLAPSRSSFPQSDSSPPSPSSPLSSPYHPLRPSPPLFLRAVAPRRRCYSPLR
jgi:hypothetical protein